MATFDQFDIESKNSFESSSVDRVFFGEFRFNETPSIEGEPRYVVGGHLEGLNLPVFSQMFVPYSIRSGYETGSLIGAISRTVSFADSEEYIADCFVPHPLLIMKANSAAPVLFQTSSTTVYGGERWGIRGLGRLGFSMAMSTNPADTIGDFPNTDCEWRGNFPFQTKYKNFTKVLRQDGLLPVPEEIGIDANDTVMTPVSMSNFMARLTIYAYSNLEVGGIPLGSIPVSLHSMVTSNSSSIIWKERELGSPSWNDLSKTFFGIGDGGKVGDPRGQNSGAQATSRIDLGRYQPTFGFQYKPGSSETANSSYVSIPLLRGYKYGLKSTIAEPVTARFSRNHYGFLRDMFEQRPGYASINKNTGARLYTPVQVRFVSGTTSFQRAEWYATSSTATDFNSRDSGVYDYFYRAGQPFFD